MEISNYTLATHNIYEGQTDAETEGQGETEQLSYSPARCARLGLSWRRQRGDEVECNYYAIIMHSLYAVMRSFIEFIQLQVNCAAT